MYDRFKQLDNRLLLRGNAIHFLAPKILVERKKNFVLFSFFTLSLYLKFISWTLFFDMYFMSLYVLIEEN